MKFFIDAADLAEINDLVASGLVDGVTTQMFAHPPADKGLAGFLADWAKTGQSILDPDGTERKAAE
jgi:transaldolase